MRLGATGLGLAALVAACGGGGGGGGGAAAPGPAPAPAATPYALTFTPSVLNLTAPQGTSYFLTVEAQIDRPIPEAVNIGIVDRTGVLQPTVSILALSQTAYRAHLVTLSTLTQGTRSGTFEIRICRDDPLACASPIAGSPWQLPFNFTITAPPTPPSPPPPPAPPPPPPPPPTVGAAFAPSSIAVTAYQDELPTIEVVATMSGAVNLVYPRFVDPDGVFQPNPPTFNVPGSSRATLALVPSIAPGSYSGNVHLQLCMDVSCTNQYPNSPALLPYTVAIRPATNLTPLAAMASAGDWATFQGNAGHTGFVPVTLDPSKFNRRWKWTIPAGDPAVGGWITPVVTADDRVYFVVSGAFRPSSLYALNESDRSVAWKYDFGSIFAANPPAVSAGKVFLATSGHADTFMWSFSASNGNSLSKVAFGSQWEHYYAPTIADGSVYTNGGTYGGLLSFRHADGSQNWFNSGLPQYDQWTPAVSATHAFTFIRGALYAIDRATGATSYSIADPGWIGYTYSQFSAPMLGGDSTVIGVDSRNVFEPNRLVAFDTGNRSVRWAIPGRFSTEPAVANGTVYTVNGGQLEARRESDGTLLWNWTPSETSPSAFDTGNPPANVVVTNNLVFVSTATSVYAIDIATRASVWSFPRGGRLGLSRNGVLYIAPLNVAPAAGDTLTAINVQ